MTLPSGLMLTLPCAPWVTAVTLTLAPSKWSLPSTAMSTGWPLVVLALSSKASCSGVTVMLTTCVLVLPSASVTVTVKLSAPL